MTTFFSPVGNDQTVDNNGEPLVGGWWEVYLAGTTTPTTTWTSNTGLVPQPAQIILDASGRPTNPIWLTGGQSVKFRLFSSLGAVLLTLDNIIGVGDQRSSPPSEWLLLGVSPTYLGAASFSVPGDQTTTLQVARRVRTINASGVVYGTIVTSVYSSVTTVTLDLDAGSLDADLSAVYCGLISAVSTSLVAFRQTGLAAIPRLFADRMLDTVSALDFMTVAQRSAVRAYSYPDVTTEIQAVVSLFPDVFFPPGGYGVSEPILGTTQQTLRGSKRAKSILKALPGFSGTAMLDYPSGTYSGVTIEGLLFNGDANADRCISMVGVSQGKVDQIIFRDVQCSLAVTTQVYGENLTYADFDHLLANGGTDHALHLKNCYTSTVHYGDYLNSAISSVFLDNCSDVELFRNAVFNNPGNASSYLIQIDGGHANKLRDNTTEPQGASNVTAEICIQDTVAGSCTDHLIEGHEFIGLSTTKTRCLIVGASGNVFKLTLRNCRFLKPAATESILLSNQAETQITMCCDLIAYDTAVYAPVTVSNASGNAFYMQSRLDQWSQIQVLNAGVQRFLGNSNAISLPSASGSSWQNPLYIGVCALWPDSTAKLRIKSGAPSGDTDGTVVGTQS